MPAFINDAGLPYYLTTHNDLGNPVLEELKTLDAIQNRWNECNSLLQDEFNEEYQARIRLFKAIKHARGILDSNLLTCIVRVTYASDNMPVGLLGKGIIRPSHQWANGHTDDIVYDFVRYEYNNAVIGQTIFQEYFSDIGYVGLKGTTWVSLEQLEALKTSLSTKTPENTSFQEMPNDTEKCREFLVSEAKKQKGMAKRFYYEGKCLTKIQVFKLCQEKFPHLIRERFEEIWKETTQTCPSWNKTGRRSKKELEEKV